VSVISASYYLQIIKVIHFPYHRYFGQSHLKSEDDKPMKSSDSSGIGPNTYTNNYLNVLYGLKSIKTTHEESLGREVRSAITDNTNSLLPLLPLTSTQETSQLGKRQSDGMKEIQLDKTNDVIQITNVHSMTISTLTLTILLFILNPSLILNSTHLMALTIFNF
jgi:hypothetical protein